MNHPSLVVSNLIEEFISIQRVKNIAIKHDNFTTLALTLVLLNLDLSFFEDNVYPDKLASDEAS